MHRFDYVAPQTVEEALELKDRWREGAAFLAGGTNLIVELRAQKIKPKIVIDLSGLRELDYIREADGRIHIGSVVTVTDLLHSDLLSQSGPVLCQAARRFATPLVRNQATVGGNLANASPAADTAVPLLALEAEAELISKKRGRRQVALADFFLGPQQTIVESDELVADISFPAMREGMKGVYIKLGRRNAMAISVVSVAVVLTWEGDHCRQARIALGAVAPTPIRASDSEVMLERERLSPALLERCGKAAAAATSPIDDIRASAQYRRAMSAVLVRRALAQATPS